MNWIFLVLKLLLVFISSSETEETHETFNCVQNKQVANADYTIIQLIAKHRTKCLSLCIQSVDCYLVSWSSTSRICILHKGSAILNLIDSVDSSTSLYVKKVDLLDGLIAYWPFKPNDTRDYVTFNDMQQCKNASFVNDRLNQPSSAIYLNNGYCQARSDVYFNGSDFTISAWINQVSLSKWSRILDFGNGPNSNTIMLATTYVNSGAPWVEIINTTGNTFKVDIIVSTTHLNNNKWQHVAGVLNATHLMIYVDGVLTNSMLNINRPKNVLRTGCFIGRSNCHINGDFDINAIIDDVKIYNRALNNDEILKDIYSNVF